MTCTCKKRKQLGRAALPLQNLAWRTISKLTFSSGQFTPISLQKFVLLRNFGEFYCANSENTGSYLQDQQKKKKGNHIKEYVVLYSGYVGIQNIKSSKEKKGIWIQKVNSL